MIVLDADATGANLVVAGLVGSSMPGSSGMAGLGGGPASWTEETGGPTPWPCAVRSECRAGTTMSHGQECRDGAPVVPGEAYASARRI